MGTTQRLHTYILTSCASLNTRYRRCTDRALQNQQDVNNPLLMLISSTPPYTSYVILKPPPPTQTQEQLCHQAGHCSTCICSTNENSHHCPILRRMWPVMQSTNAHSQTNRATMPQVGNCSSCICSAYKKTASTVLPATYIIDMLRCSSNKHQQFGNSYRLCSLHMSKATSAVSVANSSAEPKPTSWWHHI